MELCKCTPQTSANKLFEKCRKRRISVLNRIRARKSRQRQQQDKANTGSVVRPQPISETSVGDLKQAIVQLSEAEDKLRDVLVGEANSEADAYFQAMHNLRQNLRGAINQIDEERVEIERGR